MPFRNHPLRERIIGEMHLRRLPPLTAPATLLQIVSIVTPDEREAERAAILDMPGVPPGKRVERPRHAEGDTPDGRHFGWERHSEASTATVMIPGIETDPVRLAERETPAIDWLSRAAGLVIRAVRIWIVPTETEAASLLPGMGFNEAELVSCHVQQARIWSDFRMHDGDLGTLVIAAGGTPPADLGRLVQRVQELGNYRNLALLGLPMAQEMAPAVTAMERDLERITASMSDGADDQRLLDELCALAAKAAAIGAETNFRMSATTAYAQIAEQRLESLATGAVPGFQSLADFIERRLFPAVRTCASFASRLDRLSARIERATSLLRTRVDLAMQQQNMALLASMDRNAERQLKLQHLVEGLSVVAISYYAYNLVEHLLGGFPSLMHMLGLGHETFSALLVIPVFAAVWFLLRRRTRAVHHIMGDTRDGGGH